MASLRKELLALIQGNVSASSHCKRFPVSDLNWCLVRVESMRTWSFWH